MNIIRIAAMAVLALGLAGVAPAMAASNDACTPVYQASGTYGEISGEHLKPEGHFLLVKCAQDGVNISFNGKTEVSVADFVSSSGVDWFNANLDFEVLGFIPVSDGMVQTGVFETLPSTGDLASRESDIMLRAPDGLATGIAYVDKNTKTVTYLNIEQATSAAFRTFTN